MTTAALNVGQSEERPLTSDTPTKVTINQWIMIIGGVVTIAFAGAKLALESHYHEGAIKELRTANIELKKANEEAIAELKKSFAEQNAARANVIDKQREILDRMVLVCERLSINQDRVVRDLDDAIKRVRDLEKHERMKSQ